MAQGQTQPKVESNPFERAGLESFNPADVVAIRMTHHGEAEIIDFEAARAEAEKVIEPHRIGDATVIGDLTAPDVDAFLNTPIELIWAESQRAPGGKEKKDKKPKTSWLAYTASIGDFIAHGLTEHPVTKEIDGLSFVYNRAKHFGGTKKIGDVEHPLVYRTANTAEAITALVIDVDEGDTVDRVLGELEPLGLLSVVYTSYSHTTKAGPGEDRFRIVVFLKEPFELPSEGADRREAVNMWKRKYVGFCESIGVTTFDRSGMDLSRLQRPPRRPAKDAEFRHYIIAGTGLDLDAVAEGDPKKYGKKEMRARTGGMNAAQDDGGPAVLSDGFDLRAWFNDIGGACLIGSVLDMVGWETRNGDDEREILCPNDAQHSNPGDPEDSACWMKEDAEGFVISCLHDHCRGVHTWDMVRLIGKALDDGEIALPDVYESFSDLLCDSTFYPPEIDGEPVELSKYDYGVAEPLPEIEMITTPGKVRRMFKKLESASDAALAVLYAGVNWGGNKPDVLKALDDLIRDAGQHNGNDITSLRAAGKERLKEHKAAYAARQQQEREQRYSEALEGGTPDNVSLDPTEPLGDDMETALATLGHRFAACELGGQFRIVRKPDLSAFNASFDSTIAVYRKEDFLNLHLDRQLPDGDNMVNPAQRFLETAKRKSGLVFAPPPMVPGANDFNMYQGRKAKAQVGEYGDAQDFPTLHDFMLRIVCDGDEDKLNWLTLWMAHLVQRPGEKPGTSIIGVGEGGIGKGRFGALLSKLAAPHFKQLENENHVTGQFAGEHLSKCVLVVVNEAVFGASPKVSSTLKALVNSASIQVEAKGMSIVTVPSFTRFYFDSNDAVPVLIENNGSERRYFVLRFDPAEKGKVEFFETLTEAIQGQEMAALLSYLERWDPASAGMRWSDVRTAPETPERKVMGWHSMSPAKRRLLNVLQDGEIDLWVNGELETFTADGDGFRVPRAPFRDYIAAAGNKNRASDSDVPAMFAELFPDLVLDEGQGKVGAMVNGRWWHFPPIPAEQEE